MRPELNPKLQRFVRASKFELVNECLGSAAEITRLRALNAELVAALHDIEMETRPGGQWTFAEINSLAGAALRATESK
jgi:hypothetical protein